MPFYTTNKAGESVEIDSTLRDQLIKSGKKTPRDFVTTMDSIPKIGKITPVKEGEEEPAGTARYEGGTPSGRKARVTVSTVPGSLREATPEEMSDRRVMGSEGFGTVSLGQALMPRTSEVMQQMNDDKTNNYQMPGAEVDIRKPEYDQQLAMVGNAPRLGWNAFKDVASLPMRALSLHPDYAPVEYQDRGPLHQLAMTRADGMAGIARAPETPVFFAAGAGPESALGRALASTGAGLAMPALDRATDYSDETSIAPSARELIGQTALGFIPEASSLAKGQTAALGRALEDESRNLFMQQVKPLPGKNNRAVWDAVNEFSKDPALVKEVTKGSGTMRDVADAFYRGEMARAAQVDPIYTTMENEGVRVQVKPMLDRALDAVVDVKRATATPQERVAAYEELQTLLTQPEGRYLKDEILGGFGPYPITTEIPPLEARGVKSDLYGRVDWTGADKTVKSEAAKAAAASAREQLEALDRTGTLAAKNREWGKFLDAEEGFRRMESRAMNKNTPSFLNPLNWMKIAKEDPRSVYYGMALAQALQTVPQFGKYLSPGMAGLKAYETMEANP